MLIAPPTEDTCIFLVLTLVQEDVCWFDDRDPNNRLILKANDKGEFEAALVEPEPSTLP
jgi:hypothetical protein